MKILGLRIERDKRKAGLAELRRSDTTWSPLGVGADWAPESYGQYYAKSVPAYRAVKLRADAVASAPLRIYKHLPDGEQEFVGSEHPIQQIIDRVNPWWTREDLLRATETNLCLWGSAYWFLEKQGNVPVAIWPLRPDRMRIVPARSGGPNSYIAGFIYEGSGGQRIALTREELVWFRYFNPVDEFSGLSPLAAARLSLDMGRNALQFNSSFFGNGAVPNDIIYLVPGPITDEEIEDFYRRLENRHKGPKKAHRPMVIDLSQSGKPERLGLTQRDMEFLAGLNFTVEEAARVWGVPPPKMYSQTQATYNNVKQADIEFYTDTISNEWRFLEGEITEMLLPNMGALDLFAAFDTSNVLPLQEALADLHNRQRLDVAAGLLTINEVREQRHLEPVAWGDQFWGPITLTPIGEEPLGLATPLPEMALSSNGYKTLQTKAFNHLEKLEAAFIKRLDAHERQFLSFQRLIFDAQKQDTLELLRSRKSITRQAGDIFDAAEWTVRLKIRGLPVFMRIFISAAVDEAADFNLGPFNSGRESVLRWVEGRVAFWADQTNMETAKLLVAELEEGAGLGESIPQLADRVEKVFKFNNSVRAERIARTETLAASNAGHLEAYEQSGVVEEKVWLAAQDERTRPAHAEAHGQIVPLHSPFVVGGELLEAPGVGGSPGNVINCRCRSAPVLTGRRKALEAPVLALHKITRTIQRDGNGFIVGITEETNGNHQ